METDWHFSYRHFIRHRSVLYTTRSSITSIQVDESFSYFAQCILHYDDVIMGPIASQITSLTFVYSTVYSGSDQSKHQSSASLAFVWGIHRGPVNSPHKGPVTRKMFPFDDVIMCGQTFRLIRRLRNRLCTNKFVMFRIVEYIVKYCYGPRSYCQQVHVLEIYAIKLAI